jgi:hypothetical protein
MSRLTNPIPGKTWLYKPVAVSPVIAGWHREFPGIVRIDEAKQFTGDAVYAITVTGEGENPKKNFLLAVPHAHEPAGTAAAMNFLNEIITGKDLSGGTTQLPRKEILKKIRLTFIPLANPYGAKRSPVNWWDGTRYSNEAYEYIMIGRLLGDPSVKIVNKFWHYHPVFDQEVERLEKIGIVWEKLSDTLYGEPHFFKGCSWWRLVEKLSDEFHYDLFIELHQGMVDWQEMDTLVIHPKECWIPREAVAYADKVEEKVINHWKKAGAKPHPGGQDYFKRAGKGRYPDFHNPDERGKMSADWLAMKSGTPCLAIEVQINNQRTPAEEQLLYEQTAIEACAELLL